MDTFDKNKDPFWENMKYNADSYGVCMSPEELFSSEYDPNADNYGECIPGDQILFGSYEPAADATDMLSATDTE